MLNDALRDQFVAILYNSHRQRKSFKLSEHGHLKGWLAAWELQRKEGCSDIFLFVGCGLLWAWSLAGNSLGKFPGQHLPVRQKEQGLGAKATETSKILLEEGCSPQKRMP